MNSTPIAISEYFRYKNEHDKTGLLSVFSRNAVIIDRGENKELRGVDEIGSWIDKSLAGLNLKTEISQIKEEDGFWNVETIVRGDFKASPASFVYHFKLENETVSFLDIEFVGSLNK